MGALRLAVLTFAALLAGAAPAAAASGFLGTGHDPGVAVDDAGTAHVAWLTEAGDSGALEYCQVRRGTRRCAARQLIALEDDGYGKVQVLIPRPGTIHIIAPLLEPTPLISSFDGGATFTVRDMGNVGTIEKALYGPGETIAIMSNTGPASFGRFNADGSGPGDLPVEFGSAFESLDTTLAPFGAGYVALLSGRQTRSVIFSGAGDPNLQQSWVEGPGLGGSTTSPAAVGGPSGTYVAYVSRRASMNTFVRRLRSSGRFGGPVRVSRDDPVGLAFAQGPRGNMALVWDTSDEAFIVRSRKGRRWTSPRRLFRGNEPEDLRIALGRRGGWMVWDANAGNAGSHPIRVAALPGAPRR